MRLAEKSALGPSLDGWMDVGGCKLRLAVLAFVSMRIFHRIGSQ